MAGIDEGDEVTAEQMRNLFGAGKHPLAEQLRAAAAEVELSEHEHETATWLGNPFRVYANGTSAFRIRVAKEVAALNATRGQRSADPVPLDDRARIRTQVAAQLFREEYGREPSDARELGATIAQHSRPRTNAVAGYDLTFSPVKSVSTLWAIADPPTAAAIEQAHKSAVGDALAFLESTALFTREGTDGVRQVESRGLVATAFTHRDSRAGDPDLHSHVVVANKVQTRDNGRWLAIDGRLIFAAPSPRPRPTTPRSSGTRPTPSACGSRSARATTRASDRSAKSSASTRRCPPGGPPGEPASRHDGQSWPALRARSTVPSGRVRPGLHGRP